MCTLQQLPMVSTIDDAMAEGAALVHDNVPDNIYFTGTRFLAT
ncbi:MAG: hypothetical protein ACHQ4F_09765 [Candidatus Dormibacteria bacterium]